MRLERYPCPVPIRATQITHALLSIVRHNNGSLESCSLRPIFHVFWTGLIEENSRYRLTVSSKIKSFYLGRGKGANGSGTVLTGNLICSCPDIRFVPVMTLSLRPEFEADLAIAYRIGAEILHYIAIRVLIL